VSCLSSSLAGGGSYFGCCADANDCAAETACVEFAASCDAACLLNPLIVKWY
jgi:hypothetical protein